MQHRQPGAGLVAGRQQQRGGQAAVARAAQRDPRDQAGRLRVRRDRGDRPGALDRRHRAVDGEVLAGDQQRAARAACRSARRPRACGPRGRPGPHVHRPTDSGVSLARSSTVSPSTSSTLAHLQGRRRDRDAVDDQPPGALGVGHRDRRARGGVRGHAGDDVDPDRVGALVVEGGGAGGRVDAQRAQRRLVAGLDDDEQAVVVPDDVGEVLLGPADRGPPPVQGDDLGADQRVRRARRRVGDDRRVPVGVRGIGDVPALHRGVVDARDDQCVARGRPPVAAHPLHLLGGDEVGEPVAHLGAVRCGEGARRSRLQVVDVQRAAADVGDVPTVRVRPRVDHAAGRVDPPRRRLAREVDDVQLPGVRERHRARRPVGGVADDAARLFAAALPSSALLGREVLVARAVQRGGVGDQAFRAGGEVERPQAGHGVGAAAAAEEDHAVAVRGDREAARRPEREAAGAGLATRKTVGHAWQSAVTPGAPARAVSSRRARRPR